ncbi:hypothetical protein HID58_028645 [Brassica napus]|uniref:FBD domain-containing protein n=1 Tax=Brassica napus TaxID=3708 RepID=A0ABQ8CAT8_BRANA|nr:hypothetical protein HID58_028645 [Brassica napus]
MPPKVILECKDCKDMISALPDDLLVQILLFLPTEDAAPIIESLGIQLGKQCPVDTDVGNCPVLKKLSVLRDEFDDNVTTFIVKVPSLENLIYEFLSIDSPIIKHIVIDYSFGDKPPTLFFYSDGIILKLIISSLLASQKGCSRNLPISWNQPSSVPVCLLSHLEIFQFKGYRKRREEKLFVAYILANSKCLKTAGISLRSS